MGYRFSGLVIANGNATKLSGILRLFCSDFVKT
jgi:hypothetical protein